MYAASIFGLAALAELTRAQRITGPAANFVLSNVPGAPDERYLGGARLRAVFPVSLVASGMGLNVTLTSHFDTMGIGFVANRAVLPDPGLLAAHTRQAFDELSEAAFALAASDWPTRGRRRRARPPARRRV